MLVFLSLSRCLHYKNYISQCGRPEQLTLVKFDSKKTVNHFVLVSLSALLSIVTYIMMLFKLEHWIDDDNNVQ